ncbi:hypothetical protein B0H16DRAFT_1750872 [Mycena metata]|uniref:Uncharacterized protein n=1 Tax=Mycena metata TaxID=1033252 RepID=A0AAD7DM61_9AGAR|nr:hypothetical protein B0H16DRAFT_1750872 [Mycena metata]
MAPKVCWQDPDGRKVLNTIVKKVIPQWANRLRAVQEELVPPILDGEDDTPKTGAIPGESLSQYTEDHPGSQSTHKLKYRARGVIAPVKPSRESSFTSLKVRVVESKQYGLERTEDVQGDTAYACLSI